MKADNMRNINNSLRQSTIKIGKRYEQVNQSRKPYSSEKKTLNDQ